MFVRFVVFATDQKSSRVTLFNKAGILRAFHATSDPVDRCCLRVLMGIGQETELIRVQGTLEEVAERLAGKR